MKKQKILLLGAGRSATVLIEYLLKGAVQNNWQVIVADADLKLAKQKTGNHPCGEARQLDITDSRERASAIKQADVAISLLPPQLHILAAKDCIRLKKHLVTASYVSPEIQQLNDEAEKAGIVLMCELGLDPGIDHMSAMQIADRIKRQKGKIIAFKSFTGGLVAPESDDNPWHYKFSWNPKNVVLAGQGTATFIENGSYRYIPYNRIFSETETIHLPGLGEYEVYANRDSLHYRELYGLKNIPTLLRGTIRHPGYCRAWNALVKLGWTDDSYKIVDSQKLTYHRLVDAFIRKDTLHGASAKRAFAEFSGEPESGEVMKKLEWLGIFEDKTIGLKNATPAMILQNLLEEKWKMKETDKDMIVMQHQFEYEIHNQRKRLVSSMVIKGENYLHTAMAKTVGLPLGIFVKLFLQKKIKFSGVHIPVSREVYEPLMQGLQESGIVFTEEEANLPY